MATLSRQKEMLLLAPGFCCHRSWFIVAGLLQPKSPIGMSYLSQPSAVFELGVRDDRSSCKQQAGVMQGSEVVVYSSS